MNVWNDGRAVPWIVGTPRRSLSSQPYFRSRTRLYRHCFDPGLLHVRVASGYRLRRRSGRHPSCRLLSHRRSRWASARHARHPSTHARWAPRRPPDGDPEHRSTVRTPKRWRHRWERVKTATRGFELQRHRCFGSMMVRGSGCPYR